MSAFADPAFELRWLAWRNQKRGDKWTKVPFSPAQGPGSATDPTTWGTRTAAEARAHKLVNGGGAGGIGTVLGDLGNGFYAIGLDLDTCLAADGTLAPWAAKIVQLLATYTEISPSGKGLKLFCFLAAEAVRPFLTDIGVGPTEWGTRRGIPGEDGKDHGPAVELYCSHRYFTVTEKQWPGTPDTITYLEPEILEELIKLIPPPKDQTPGAAGDDSRSAKAFRKGAGLRRAGKSFEEMVAALRADPETADWVREKGDAANGRELRRLWDGATKNETNSSSEIPLDSGAEFIMQKIDWLWKGWLARGKFHLLAGSKSAGKSTIAFDLMAAITSGRNWPDGSPAPLGDVLVWSGEDDIADTILPRFVAAGGDRKRIYFVTKIFINGLARPFDPSADMPALIARARTLPDLKFIMIDPVVLAIPSTADSHKNAETRRGLQPLVDFAEELGIALLGITHFTKGTFDQDPIERVTGSLAFAALARIVLGTSADEDGNQRRLVRIASNIGPSGGGIEYTLYQAPLIGHDFNAQRIAWGAILTGPPRDLLSGNHRSAQANAVGFLTDFLKDGEKPAKEVKEAADAFGHSWATVRLAQQKLGIKPRKLGPQWIWELPVKPVSTWAAQ